MEKVILFNTKEECCGCGACMNVYPKNAIAMKEDEYGFIYPQIDESLCIGCQQCKKVCSYQNEYPENEPLEVFAAVNKDETQLMKSASGGAFTAIATKFLNEKGVVFGATLTFEDGNANPHHTYIESLNNLSSLQGSKYVQSSIEFCYKNAKRFLHEGRKVLFSGTPCQIAGLYGYLGKDYENLLTIDVICHGVPNAKLFNDYLQNEKMSKSADKVIDYSFRDKTKGWGMNTRLDLMKSDHTKTVYSPARLKSYNTFFLDGDIYRQNCYSCKYAGKKRVSDLTIGDYWGIEKEHPELLTSKAFDEKKGISCVLANTNKGQVICKDLSNLSLASSSFDKVSKKNGQLNRPTKHSEKRETILDIYRENGFLYLNKWFLKKYKKQVILHGIFNKIPRNLRNKMKLILKGE